MIAIPVVARDKGVLKTVNLFTRAKTFALVNEQGAVELLEHGHDSGKILAQDLLGRGVKVLITSHIGRTPYEMLQAAGVSIQYVKGSFAISEMLEMYQQGKLETLSADQVHASKHQHQHQGDQAHDCGCGS